MNDGFVKSREALSHECEALKNGATVVSPCESVGYIHGALGTKMKIENGVGNAKV